MTQSAKNSRPQETVHVAPGAPGPPVDPVAPGAPELADNNIFPMTDDDLVVLKRIMEGTARATGESFLHLLVQHLAGAIDVHYAFVAEFAGSSSRVQTLAFWMRDRFADNVEWDLVGTPCEDVIKGQLCHHPAQVRVLFPEDRPLVEMGIESYLGVPLLGADGRTLGHLAVFDERPMPRDPRRLYVFRIFAERAAAELERLHADARLRESEHQFRDLFEEAPIAYVYEETSTRFVSANRAFMDLLGLSPEDVPGTCGLSLVAPAPDVQGRVHESLASERGGKDRGAIEIELRRKDNGTPVWVQRWSKPEPDGKHTRTMIVDITARVLAEREKARLQQQNRYLREEINAEFNFEEIIGASPAIRRLLRQIEQVAPTDSTVLITGETGTGKELIARAIHNNSARRDQPLIKLNCAALPGGLVESELFGHEKGAFTGAVEKRIGRFALADRGTIFLDEIGDMPMDVQTKLLRVLQEKEFEPVGATRSMKVDVRVIAATNRDLARAVQEGAFRADLYYRLNVFPVVLPPLRERGEDIPLLVHFFLERYATKIGRRFDHVSPESMARLIAYAWPGNIRELENIVERAVILCPGPVLEVDAGVLQPTLEPAGAASTAGGDGAAMPVTLAEGERRHILRALEVSNWVIDGERGAAKVLDLHPNTLRSRLKKLGIERSRHASS